jgi:hypothetical protein
VYEVVAESTYQVCRTHTNDEYENDVFLLKSYTFILMKSVIFQEETQAFAGLVQAMYDTDTVAIVRRCFSERSSPEIGFLRPHIAHDHIVSHI